MLFDCLDGGRGGRSARHVLLSPPPDLLFFFCRPPTSTRPVFLSSVYPIPPPHPTPPPLTPPLVLSQIHNSQQDVEGLGEAGTEASVRPGYARNALLPRGAAELVPHRRARRESRPPRSVLLRNKEEEEEKARKESITAEAKEASAAVAAAAAEPADVESEGGEEAASSSSPARLVAVARSLSRGALEFVRPLRPDESGSAKDDDDENAPSSSAARSSKIAEPIDAEAFAAAVASQKRIALDPRLVVLDKPIDEQGEHSVPLRMRLGGERVVVRALVGLAAASSGGGDERKGGGGKKKGGKR